MIAFGWPAFALVAAAFADAAPGEPWRRRRSRSLSSRWRADRRRHGPCSPPPGFATPIGYRSDTMVHARADHHFPDFVKTGPPMNVIVGIATCIAITWLVP